MSSRRFEDVFKTSWNTKNCYAEDALKTSSRHVLQMSSRCHEDQQMFAGKITIHESGFDLFIIKIRCYQFDKIQAVS